MGLRELGWMLLEARRGIAELKPPAPAFPFPEWRGEPLAGRHIVVVAEQGAGDQIMFARYAAVLAARGARVTYGCQESLAGLLPSSASAVARGVTADFWAPMMSLPHRLGLGAEIPPPARIALPSGSGGGVGVMATGSPTHLNDLNRSLTGRAAARLLALGRDLSPAATGAASFRETAEIISGLDLVISVDTAVAHLAASMGKPTWILLPALGVDWRWGWSGETTPWYPAARLYRQPQPGAWSSVLDEVERDLAALGP
jgi:hypothetical protein